MKRTLIILVILVFLFPGCYNQGEIERSLGDFDISKNDTHIVFAYNIDGVSSIYQMQIDGSEIVKLISSDEGVSYVNPKYSPDGSKIIFISHPSGEIKSNICTVNRDGSQLETHSLDSIIVTEALFSSSRNLIYFCGATDYRKSSPIGIRSAHDFDIYSLSLDDKSISKLSNLCAYNINNISEVDSTNLLMGIEAGPSGGIYTLSVDKPETTTPSNPINNPRGSASMYSRPIFSRNYGVMAFTAPYELYLMDATSKKAQLIYGPKNGSGHLKNICFYNTKEEILFSKISRSGEIELMSIGFEGKQLKKIPINLPQSM
ncbi:hypothetical protein EYV94_05635 [Puteibacter caeruleilacunae]|nr:hypothetical protein EYV94_05635 [Puteibacter caeruleilacunae]